MSKNIVFEGWLTKSPPAKRIWRAKWRRRWFCLRQSGELPGQYFLDYYADQNCRRLKGTINLDLCEQVDAGLHMNRGPLDSTLKGSVFTVRTQSRTYHLEADCQLEMEKWVDAICSVCGLRATDDSDVNETYQNNMLALTATNNQYNCMDTGTYIPISECRTGARVQDGQRTFTFDAKDLMSNRRSLERVSNNKAHLVYTSQPHIRLNADFSENESNMSDDDCKSLNASETNIEDWHVERSFKKLGLNSKRNGYSEEGPPVPPRPPKTLIRDPCCKEAYHGPVLQEPMEHNIDNNLTGPVSPSWGLSRRSSGIQPSPSKYQHRYIDDDDDHQNFGHPSLQYFNLTSLPPAVDRALKPRHSSFGHINHLFAHQGLVPHGYREDDAKANILQYLDLDLHNSKPPISKPQVETRRKLEVNHGKSLSAMESDSAYKTVDFLKTEAFNSTRQDAEASRNTHH